VVEVEAVFLRIAEGGREIQRKGAFVGRMGLLLITEGQRR